MQNFDPVLAANNFEQACSQNSFILKFIQPQNYPQRISYIRTEDGGMKNVQIRVTGTSTGSQKKLWFVNSILSMIQNINMINDIN